VGVPATPTAHDVDSPIAAFDEEADPQAWNIALLTDMDRALEAAGFITNLEPALMSVTPGDRSTLPGPHWAQLHSVGYILAN